MRGLSDGVSLITLTSRAFKPLRIDGNIEVIRYSQSGVPGDPWYPDLRRLEVVGSAPLRVNLAPEAWANVMAEIGAGTRFQPLGRGRPHLDDNGVMQSGKQDLCWLPRKLLLQLDQSFVEEHGVFPD